MNNQKSFKIIRKNLALVIALGVILILGIVLLFVTVNQLNVLNAQITSLQKTVTMNNNRIKQLTTENASTSAQIKLLMNQPIPAPEVKYASQPQQVTQCPYPYVLTGGKCVNFYFLRGY
jgi:cell division protein FtsB